MNPHNNLNRIGGAKKNPSTKGVYKKRGRN